MNFKKLRIGHLSTVYHANFILMRSTQLENVLGLNLEWNLFGTGPLMIKAFKEEKLDIGYIGLPPAIIGIDQDVKIKCVAGGHVEGTIMIAKKNYKNYSQLNESHEEVLAQFKGKIIGVTSKGSIHEVILSHYLEKVNLQDEIQVKNYDHAEFIAMDMKKNRIEAGVGTPALAVFASSIMDSHVLFNPDSLWSFNPSYGIFFHENLINNQPEIVEKFLVHDKKAVCLIRKAP
ncbi:MAG: ABC transporter substrate-binding protein, partial [Candidatus Helarchaeota archaeon]